MTRLAQKRTCRAHVPDGKGALKLSDQRAFSLIELLLVCVIILIMATIYLGKFKGQREEGLACAANLQKLYVSLDVYARDSSGKYPEVPGAQTSEEPLSLLVPRYTADTSAFICPISKDLAVPSGEPFQKKRISYAYYMGRGSSDLTEVLITDRQVNTESKATGQPIFSVTGKAPGNNHKKGGGNLLFVDGHVDPSPPIAAIPLMLTQGVVLLNPKR